MSTRGLAIMERGERYKQLINSRRWRRLRLEVLSLCASCHRAEHLRMGKNGREERQRRCQAEAEALSRRLWGIPGIPGAEPGKQDSRAGG